MGIPLRLWGLGCRFEGYGEATPVGRQPFIVQAPC